MDTEKITENGKNDNIPAIVVTRDGSEQTERPRVVRKTSIRRRVSKDDKKGLDLKPYGNLHEEYDKIVEQMMEDKGVQNTIEALNERWRMIMFMYDDCMDTFKTKNEMKALQQKLKRRQALLATLIIYCSVSLPFLVIFIALYIIIF